MRPVSNENFQLKFSVLAVLSWIIRNFRDAHFSKRQNILAPPLCLPEQRIHDKKNDTWFSVFIGGRSNFRALQQVVIEGCYQIERLARHTQTIDWYEICANNKSPLIIDCGANIGISALYCVQRLLRARIIAVEPDLDKLLWPKSFVDNGRMWCSSREEPQMNAGMDLS